MSHRRTRTLLAVSVAFAIYGPNVFAEADLPVLTETQAQGAAQEESLTIERTDIQATPLANPDLAELLKAQSGVAINDGRASLRGGDLAPAEISLADARPHQTNYMIGGVTTNNITSFAGSASGASLSGHTSGYFFDANLLGSVQVLDHNIGAEYGGFTGGIINAELRKPTDEFTTEYTYRMNDSDWNKAPQLDEDTEDFDSPTYGDGRYQPQYQKRFHALFVSGPVNDNHKVAVGLSVQKSDIPVLFDGQWQDEHQTNTNLYVNHVGQIGEWALSNEIRFSGLTEDRFLNDALNHDASQPLSAYEKKHGGYGATINLERHLGWATWKSTLAYDRLSDEHDSEVNYYKTLLDYGSFDFSSEGSYANLEQAQNSYKFKSQLDFEPLYSGSVRHTPQVGIEAQWHKGEGEFHQAYNSFRHLFNYRRPPTGSNGEFIDNWSRYQAGRFHANAEQFALFISDELAWEHLTARLGLRAEHLDLFDETVLAPRLTVSWDFAADNINRVTLGSSRYYSGSLLGWSLKSEKAKLKTTYLDCVSPSHDYSSLNPDDYQCADIKAPGLYIGSDINTPYSDEITGSYQLSIDNVLMTTEYIYRMQRDGIANVYDADIKQDKLINQVRSNSHILRFKVGNRAAYELLSGYANSYFSMGYVDHEGTGERGTVYGQNNSLYDGTEDSWVLLDGELMRLSEMDTGSYNSDFTAALGFNIGWPQYGINWNNLVNHEGGRKLTLYKGYDEAIVDGQSTSVMAISSEDMDALTTWNTKLSWSPKVDNKQFTIGLTITNVLNSQVKIATHGTDLGKSKTVYNYYNKGREIWLNVGFKL